MFIIFQYILGWFLWEEMVAPRNKDVGTWCVLCICFKPNGLGLLQILLLCDHEVCELQTEPDTKKVWMTEIFTDRNHR